MADLVGTGSTGGTQTSNPANLSWVDIQTDKMRKAGIFTN